MERLSETQKQVLCFLAKSVREKTVPEEFTVLWWRGEGAISAAGPNPLSVPNLTKLTLQLLSDEGLVFSQARYENTSSEFAGRTTLNTEERSRTCVITPSGYRAVDSDFAPVQDLRMHRPPVEITDSLARFRADFPDSTRLAFIMMQFGTSPTHQTILAAIRSALDPHQIVALRADDKQYHDDLYFNILTYIYGCRFGIAVFERIEADAFNPNVSLEVGYMLGLGKSVCFLKEKTLRTLHADLVGKLYRVFDAQAPESIAPELFAWMEHKGFIVRR